MSSLRITLLFVCLVCFGTGCGRAVEGNAPGITGKSTQEDNLTLGLPSPADSNAENCLLQYPSFAVSYNSNKKIPNWVSWHLNSAWNGYSDRHDRFHADENLPGAVMLAQAGDYRHSGFDRGHLCPSDDRDLSGNDNSSTFAMSNIAPQLPELNRDTWEKLEAWCREQVADGKELYIIAGTHGERGTIAGKIVIPASFWKVILVLEEGTNDLERINSATRVIAVNIPNKTGVSKYSWGHYRTTVEDIEKLTGADLFSALPTDLQHQLGSKIDSGPTR